MLDAAANGGIVENIDDRAVHIGNGNPGLAAPYRLGAEDQFFADVPEGKHRALALDGLFPDGSGREHDDVPKDLLGEVPMLGGCSPADIGWNKQGRYEYPRVLNDLLRVEQVELTGT